METWKCEYCGRKNSCEEDLNCRKCGAPQPEELPEPQEGPASGEEPKKSPDRGGEIFVVIFACFLVLIVIFGLWSSLTPPVTPLPEGYFVVRPVWHTMDKVPDDLYRLSAPAILIDPNDRLDKRILGIIGAEGPGQYDPKEISDWGNRLMAWGDAARPYVWFQPYGCTELLGGSWSEYFLRSNDRKLFQRWFEEADLILIEET